jgi:hypothetical protein
VLFADMAVPQTTALLQNQFGISAAQGPNLFILFLGRPGALSPVISALEERGLVKSIRDQTKERVLVGVEIPYTVEHHVIDDVCDLRLPECGEYVIEEFFKKDTPSLQKINRKGIENFVEALPVLMHPELGGGPHGEGNGAILQALAAFLRMNGAKGLVFPSARSDVLAEIRDRNLVRWSGWCLVDYRDAPPPIITRSFDMSEGWSTTFPKGATIGVAKNGEYRGSFQVTGIVAWGRERVGEIESQFVAGQRDG